jgi:hypothetical protein
LHFIRFVDGMVNNYERELYLEQRSSSISEAHSPQVVNEDFFMIIPQLLGLSTKKMKFNALVFDLDNTVKNQKLSFDQN